MFSRHFSGKFRRKNGIEMEHEVLNYAIRYLFCPDARNSRKSLSLFLHYAEFFPQFRGVLTIFLRDAVLPRCPRNDSLEGIRSTNYGLWARSRRYLAGPVPTGTFALMTRVRPSSERISSLGVAVLHVLRVVLSWRMKVMSVARRLRRKS